MMVDNTSRTIKLDKFSSYAVSAAIFYPAFNMFIQIVSKLLNISTEFTNELIIVFTLLTLFVALVKNRKRIKTKYLTLPFIILFLYMFSYLIFIQNREFLKSMILLNLTISILSFIAVSTITNYKVMLEIILKIGKVIIIMMAIIVLLKVTGRYDYPDANYMGISYALLLPVTIILNSKKKTKFEYSLLVIGIFLLVTSGGRGPLIILMLFYLFLKFKEISKSPVKLLSFSAIMAALILFYQKLINMFVIFTSNRNFGGNITNYILKGNIFSDSSRSELFRASLNIIKDNFIFGVGLGGDRAVLPYYSNVGGIYTHNFFTEVFVHYGIFLGSVLVICFLMLILNTFFSVDSYKKQLFYCFFFSNGFMQLMFSSSYLLSPAFFVLLALLSSSGIRKTRIIKYTT